MEKNHLLACWVINIVIEASPIMHKYKLEKALSVCYLGFSTFAIGVRLMLYMLFESYHVQLDSTT